jgi:hypothetical protein
VKRPTLIRRGVFICESILIRQARDNLYWQSEAAVGRRQDFHFDKLIQLTMLVIEPKKGLRTVEGLV